MASPRAILRASKAAPGGARPTPAPQGPGIGQISPLAAQLANENPYANMYGPFLPRPSRTFTEGAFGPFSPILPVPVDAPDPGSELPAPRRFDYPVGFNLPSEPGNDGFKLASFTTLQSIANIYSIARTCIQRRKDEIAGLDWDIVPTHEASKAYQGDHQAMRDFGERRAEAVKFFKRPDPNYFGFDGFLKALLEQVFVYDALSLLLRPRWGRGLKRGLLGSDLDSFELVDGATIRPLLDLHGGVPRPPAPAWQQYLKGVPRSDFTTLWSGRDLEEAGLRGAEAASFRSDQLLYLPTNPRANTPYGFGATEQALIVIMTGLRKQAYQLEYYSEGTVPAVYISPGDVNITPNQVRELQEALNAYAGDQAWHHKIIVLPPGSRVDPQRPQDLADQFDEIIMTEVAMVYDVDPMSLGIIPQVSTAVSPFAAKEMAQASRTVHDRTSTKPLLKFLCNIFNAVLHQVAGQDDMKFTFAGLDEVQDTAATTDLLVKQVQNGIRSVDEAREELDLTPWGLPETSGPVVFTQMGVVPFEWVPGSQLEEAVQGGAYSGETETAEDRGQQQVAGRGGDTRPMGVHHPPSSRPVGTHNPRLGLPSGSNLRAETPPQRAGRGTAQTPAHAAAQGAQRNTRQGKAVTAELEALSRHLRKGRHITTWEPRHIPGAVLASIAEDLTKGLTVDEAVGAVVLPKAAYEWADKATPAQGQNPQQQTPAQQAQTRAQQLATTFAARIRAAFLAVAKAALRLIRMWLTGALAVTALALAGMISELVGKHLTPVLNALWRDAWHLGTATAEAVLRDENPDWAPGAAGPGGASAAMDAWIASHGRDTLEGITTTRVPGLADMLSQGSAAGETAEHMAEAIPVVLGFDQRPDLIAVSEVERGKNGGLTDVYQLAGVMQKQWVTMHDGKVCGTCRANEAQGWIAFNAPFQSGNLAPLAHPRCRCHLNGRLAPTVAAAKKYTYARTVDSNGQEYWPVDSYQSGTAPGMGGPMPTVHDATDTQVGIAGGVPGSTAGGEPPRWDGGDVEHLVTASPRSESEGRGNVQTLGGGTVGGPYRDRSDETHVGEPSAADDADWPEHRGIPPRLGRDWPAPYMDGYWPAGGIGTTQAPGSPIVGGERGRPPNAHGKTASGYDLSPRSGMISLDIPEGTITPVPGGVTDHHITVVYLGPDVDDSAFMHACMEARRVAAGLPGPLAGVITGIGSFEPSSSSDGKIPVWAGVMLPGAERLREGLEHLSASEHKNWQPHVTLAYAEVGEALPEPVSPTPVTFTHLSVHRGGDIVRFPLGAAADVVKGAADLDDPNPVDPEHVKALMEKNFPEKALTWVNDAHWIGPIEIPQDRIDTDDEESWAASHQPQAVKRFAKHIKHGTGHTQPAILIQHPGSQKAIIIDGHHRTLAYRKLGRPVKAYVGMVDRITKPMLETHSFQISQGASPQNKSAETPTLEATPDILGPNGLWHTPDRHVGGKQKLPNYIEHIAHALMRDQGMGESQAIATAINAVKRWAAGDLHWGKGKVTPEVQAASQRALAEWEALRAWIASHGRDTLEGITTTRVPGLADMLSQGSAAGETAEHTAGHTPVAQCSARGKGKVTPEVQAASQRALAEWEALRASHH